MNRISESIRRVIIALAIFIMVNLAASLFAKELPGEGTLPGQARPKKKNLPAESTLPGVVVQKQKPGRRLPGEDQLPGTLVTQTDPQDFLVEPFLEDDDVGIPSPSDPQPEPKPGAVAIGQAPLTYPWLRLNMDGHTGTVREISFSPDGTHLFSGGDDKALEMWSRLQLGVEKPHWMHRRTVRWQVHRGPRGRIQAIAVNADTVALAGYGAMSEMGEILLIDPVTGALKRSLFDAKNGHRQPVVSLSFAPTLPILASQDVSGRALLWIQDAKNGLWKPRQLTPPDPEQYGEKIAALLKPRRRQTPIVMAGDHHVVLPTYFQQIKFVEDPTRDEVVWHLRRIDVRTMQQVDLNASVENMEQKGIVTAMAASIDGKRLVSADMYGRMQFWNIEDRVTGALERQNVTIASLSIARNRRMLIAGSNITRLRNGTGLIQLWNLNDGSKPQKINELSIDQLADAVSLSPTGDLAAYTQGGTIVLKPSADIKLPQSERLVGRTRPVSRVAFSAKEPFYRIAFGTGIEGSGGVALERSFDLEQVRLEAAPRLNNSDWLDSNSAQGQWNLSEPKAGGDGSYWLYQGNNKAARLPLRVELHGLVTATYWIAGKDNQPAAVAVGTSHQNMIYVFRRSDRGEAKLLRQFRGHEGTVRSISVSRDGRYLVSSADDATMRVWNLNGFATDPEIINRWGTEFAVQEGQLVVSAIREDGPLFFRGLRTGDTITSLGWFDGKQRSNTNQLGEMLEILRGEGGRENVAFYYRRGQQAQPSFHQYAGWQPLASIFVAENREWAFWTPAGYYDASFDGHKLFGWQINPDNLERMPEFFLAAQFQKALERPQVMAQLLRTGSLEAAFRAVRQLPPGNAENAVLDQYRLKPRVKILSPKPDATVSNSRAKIHAVITVRDGLQLTPPKAFANGVVANNRRLVSEKVITGGREMHFEWDAQLPSDPRVVVQVVASTDAAVVDTQSVVVRHKLSPAKRQPKLYIVAAGINQYRDAQIQRLDYAVSNARSVVELLRSQAKSLYATEATMLLDNQATRPMWSVITRESADRLRQEAQADDLLVFFLSGHGVRDEETQKYYFVAADARFDDVKARRFSGCLSFEDFAAFADVPCRKLVVLDTCHSGAVQQPLRQQDLKAALRALQTDVVFTMTASEGSQEASEQKQKQLGRFTARLLEALSGMADKTDQGGDGNKIVTLNEAFRYVSAAVHEDSQDDEQIQHPTVGPIDLLDYAVLPLTSRP